MTHHEKPLSGVVAILVTPFTAADELDLDGLAAVVDYTIALGAHGVGIGLASEYLTLSDVECVTAARALVRAAAGRVPAMMSCGRPSTAATVALARAIAAEGVDALMVLPPYVMPPGAAGLEAHYRAVAEAVPTPLVVQDAPSLSGVNLSPELLAGMVRTLDTVRYLKIEALPPAPKIAAVARLLDAERVQAGALIGGAGGTYLVDELRAGARATMPGCAYVDLLVRVWDLYQAGEVGGARRALHAALPLLLYCGQSFSAFVGTQNELLRRAGVVRSARLRAPAEQFAPDLYAEFATLLGEARAAPV
jgi:4-hydroxy-tetrahydrodipicolinate synthase